MISRRQFFGFVGGAGTFGASTAAYGVGESALGLRVVRYDLAPKQWPADLPLTIAVVADLHACDPWMGIDRIETIVERTNALGADIIVLLGDYVAGHHHVTRKIPAAEWAPVLGALSAPLGVHAILGNHDWWDDRTAQRDGRGPTVARRALEAAGIPVYENDAVALRKDGQRFWLAGLGDQLAYVPARRFRPVRRIGVDDLHLTLGKISDDTPVILLAHEPDIAVRVPKRVALQLSGHTHGGQVRLLGWSPVTPSGRRLVYGHVRMNCDVVISGGLGCSIMPFRIGVPPGNHGGDAGRGRFACGVAGADQRLQGRLQYSVPDVESCIRRGYVLSLRRSLIMKTTVVIDDELFAMAQECTGLQEKSAVIREALTALVQREAARRLARMGGTSPGLKAPPRRRPPY